MTRYIVCAEPIEEHVAELVQLGADPTAAIMFGILTSAADTVWVNVEPLPEGQAFNLRSWDEPIEREPGWHSFKGCSWVANAANLVAFRVEEEG